VANPEDPPIHKSSNPNASRHVIDSSEPSGWTFGEHYSLLPSRYLGSPLEGPASSFASQQIIQKENDLRGFPYLPLRIKNLFAKRNFTYDTFVDFRDGNGKLLISLSKNGNTNKAEECQENPILF